MSDKAMASTDGATAPYMKACGKRTKRTAEEPSGTPQVISTSVSFFKTKHMDLESISTKMEAGMKETGKRMYNMVKVKKFGKTVQNIQAITKME